MLRIEVITPERIAYEGEADLVVVPTQSGTLGIGRGHIPLIASLKPGEVIVRHTSKEPEYLAVAGGFVEILPDIVRVLAHSAELSEELDAEAVEAAVLAAKEAREGAGDTVQVAETSARLAHELSRLKVAGRRRSHRHQPEQD